MVMKGSFLATAAVCALKVGMLLATDGGTSFTLAWFTFYCMRRRRGRDRSPCNNNIGSWETGQFLLDVCFSISRRAGWLQYERLVGFTLWRSRHFGGVDQACVLVIPLVSASLTAFRCYSIGGIVLQLRHHWCGS